MCLFLRREKVNGVKKDNKIVNLNNYIVLLRVLSSYWENSVSIQAVFPSHTQSHSIERKKKKLALKHYGPIKPYQIKYSYLFYNYFSFKHSVIFPSSILKWPTNGRRKTSQHDFCVRQDSADIEFFVYVKLLLQQKFLL